MASLETVSPLELERSVFDSDETRILSTAFKRAWAYVEFDATLGLLKASERQSELARCLMALLKLGNNDPVSLANSGIALLHMSQGSGLGEKRSPAFSRGQGCAVTSWSRRVTLVSSRIGGRA